MLPLHARPHTPAGPLCSRLGGREWSASLRTQPSHEATEAPSSTGRNISHRLAATVCSPDGRQAGPLAEDAGRALEPELFPRDAGAVPDNLQSGVGTSLSFLLGQLTSAGVWLADVEELEGLSQPAQIQVDRPRQTQIQTQSPKRGKDPKKREDFYANVGEAIRTLRTEIPLLFQQDLTYDIYRDDITFRDPRNAFHGKKDYKTIFWSLRFHGRLFFKVLYVDVLRIWESPENVNDAGTVLKMRWSVHGIPRVPWNAEGIFDGISTFKLDSNGKIYEHAVDNIILKDPPKQGNPFLAGLNLIPLPQQQQPCPGAWFSAQKVKMEERGKGAEQNAAQVATASYAEEF